LWPEVLRAGERILVAFRAARVAGMMRVPSYEVTVFDSRRRRVATLLRGRARPSAGVVCVDWDGRDDRGALVPPGAYQLRVEGPGSSPRLERTLLVTP
jgi:flagellar hook assembly protein FlgD